jgi:hypothetical protein
MEHMMTATQRATRDEPPAPLDAPIKRGEVYPLRLFLRLTRMGSRGLRRAQDEGLRVVYQGRTAFVSGDDFADWILSPQRTTERWANAPEVG